MPHEIPLAPDPLQSELLPLDHACWERDVFLMARVREILTDLVGAYRAEGEPVDGDALVACAFHAVAFHLGRSDVTALLRQRLRSEHPASRRYGRILVEHGAVVRVRRRYLVASPDPTTLAIAALITPSN